MSLNPSCKFTRLFYCQFSSDGLVSTNSLIILNFTRSHRAMALNCLILLCDYIAFNIHIRLCSNSAIYCEKPLHSLAFCYCYNTI